VAANLPGRDRCRRDEARTLRPLQAAALAYRIAFGRVLAAIGLATNPGDRKSAALTILLEALAKAIKTSRHQRQIIFPHSVALASYP
jgi:hypothetical protein